MKRFVMVGAIALTLVMAFAQTALAGNPHFVYLNKDISGSTATVSGKVAGLGNETQTHVTAEAEVACLPKCSPPMTLVWGPITVCVSGASFETFCQDP